MYRVNHSKLYLWPAIKLRADGLYQSHIYLLTWKKIYLFVKSWTWINMSFMRQIFRITKNVLATFHFNFFLIFFYHSVKSTMSSLDDITVNFPNPFMNKPIFSPLGFYIYIYSYYPYPKIYYIYSLSLLEWDVNLMYLVRLSVTGETLWTPTDFIKKHLSYQS